MQQRVFGLTRRAFLQTSAGVGAAAVMAQLGTNFAHAAGSEKIRVGVIGCGGRGRGAAVDCVKAAENVQIVALGDVFQDRLNQARERLPELGPEHYSVTDDRCFVGFDAYKGVIDAGVDLVILATPPCFRPQHIEAAINAGKHIFAEKPVAVDPAGARQVMAAADLAQQKGLGFVAGTQRRHEHGYVETMKRIHDGAIGEIVAATCYWNQGGLWMHPRKPEWSDMEWQLRNWIYFTWLSGDHIVEQHVHQIDVMNWVFKGPPISAYGMGGRQARTDPAYGHVYDHFAVEFEYPGGARVMSMCRQIDGTDSRVDEHLIGTKGTAAPKGIIKPADGKTWRFDQDKTNKRQPYEQEHTDLIESIRAGKPLNEARQIAESTMAAIMGRMSAYSGKLVTWEQAMESTLDLTPSKLEMGEIAVPEVAVPGKTPLV
jgi:myo-inositol 2-dehydrogenase / D-chiro-inositol 1-dehydrogenase